jgi:hypothetical protein
MTLCFAWKVMLNPGLGPRLRTFLEGTRFLNLDMCWKYNTQYNGRSETVGQWASRRDLPVGPSFPVFSLDPRINTFGLWRSATGPPRGLSCSVSVADPRELLAATGRHQCRLSVRRIDVAYPYILSYFILFVHLPG